VAAPSRPHRVRGVANEFVGTLLPETEADPAGLLFQFHWVRARFIDPAPHGYVPITDAETKMTRVFIPSRVENNLPLQGHSAALANIRISKHGGEQTAGLRRQ
jgi:hypothetical protein